MAAARRLVTWQSGSSTRASLSRSSTNAPAPWSSREPRLRDLYPQVSIECYLENSLSYYRPDGIEAFAAPDGGFDLLVTRRGRIYDRHIGPDDFVTLIEAGVILRPPVSRVAVYKWVKGHKLKADLVDRVLLIQLSRLRKFAAKRGYGFAGPPEAP